MFLCKYLFMQKTYFLIEESDKLKDQITSLQRPSHLSYGAFHLEQESLIIWDNATYNKFFSLSPHSQVVINNPMFAFILKRLGHKVVLINVNSNHVLARSASGFKKWIIKQIYNSCDTIMCLDKMQVEPLQKFGITAKLVVNPLLVDTELTNIAQNQVNTFDDFYLSSGFDAGANFDFSAVRSRTPIVCITKSNPLPYNKYVYLLCKCKLVILKRINNPAASDLTGNTTVIEALAARKPVLINAQPWLAELKEPNIHIYKDDIDLERMLIQDNLNWKYTDNDYSIEKYLKKLKSILQLKVVKE